MIPAGTAEYANAALAVTGIQNFTCKKFSLGNSVPPFISTPATLPCKNVNCEHEFGMAGNNKIKCVPFAHADRTAAKNTLVVRDASLNMHPPFIIMGFTRLCLL